MFISFLVRGKKRWIGMALTFALIILLSGAISGFAEQKDWELINWNEPQSWQKRLLDDRYVLPQGWDKATEGVEEIVVFNVGGLRGDIASVMNYMRFEELTGIKVTAIPLSPGVVEAKTLSTLVTKDRTVDAVTVIGPDASLSTIAAGSWLTPVDHLWPPEVLDLYSPRLKSSITWENHQWPLIAPVACFVEWYRPSWLAKAGVTVPDTWQEYYTAAKKCRTYGKQNLGVGYYGTTFVGGDVNLVTVLRGAIYSQGKKLYENGKYQFSSPEFKNAFEMITNFVNEGIASQEVLTYTSVGDVTRQFGMGRSAFMTCNVSSSYPGLRSQFPEVADDFAVFATPKWSTKYPESYRGGVVQVNQWFINKYIDDEQKAAVMLFGDYVRSMEAQRNEVIVEGNESLLLELWKNPNEAIDKVDWNLANRAADGLGLPHYERIESVPIKDARRLTIENAMYELYPPGYSEIREKIIEMFSNVALGKTSSDEACEEIQKFAEQTLP